MSDLNLDNNKDLEKPTVFTFGDRFNLITLSRNSESINKKMDAIQTGIFDKVEEIHKLVNSIQSQITSMSSTITSHDKQLTDFKDIPERISKIEDKVSFYGKVIIVCCGTILLAALNSFIKLIIK